LEPAERARAFREQGYLVERGFFSPGEATGLIDEIVAADASDPHSSPLSRGSMSFYSNVFQRSRRLRAFVSQQRLIDLLTPLAGPNLFIRWDQAVDKGPGAPVFPWHQDNGYSRLRDAYFQLWIALSAGTKTNGGLWVAPGSHRSHLPHRRVGTHMAALEAPPDPVLIEAEPGDVVVFSSLLLHSTEANTSEENRWAYVVEYMSTRHFDPSIDPPYFTVAKKGRSQPEWRRFTRGRLDPRNQLKYLPRRALPLVREGTRRLARKLLPPVVTATRRRRCDRE